MEIARYLVHDPAARRFAIELAAATMAASGAPTSGDRAVIEEMAAVLRVDEDDAEAAALRGVRAMSSG